MLLWQPRSLPRLSLEKCRQRWPVLLLVGTVPKQAAQVGTGSRRVFSLDRIANADCTRREAFVGACDERGDPDVGTIVLAGAAFARDKNDELLFHRRFRERAGVSQYIARVQALFETGQARPVRPKSLGRQRGVSGVRPKVRAVSSITQGQQVPGDVVNPPHGRSCGFGAVLIAGPDTGYHAGKVPVSTAESSGISRNVADRSATLQQMEIAEWRGTSLNGRHQAVGDVHCSDTF